MAEFVARVATHERFDLAEGITWDAAAQLVRWVDIRVGAVLAGQLSEADEAPIHVSHRLELGQTVGAVSPARDGGLLVAGATALLTVSPAGEIRSGPDLIPPSSSRRLNDAKVDPHGNLIVGSLSLTDSPGDEVLLRVTPSGEVTVLREGLGLSNGIGFAPDGAHLYHIDTLAGTLSTHAYRDSIFDDTDDWQIVIDDFPFHPDGMTVDATGAIWVAMWGGSRVVRYAPTGEMLDTVHVNAQHVTCPAFVGANHQLLGISTALKDIDDTVSDSSGALFIADVGVVGLRRTVWPGSTSSPAWHSDKSD